MDTTPRTTAPPYKASVLRRANEASTRAGTDQDQPIVLAIMLRIKKCLARAEDSGAAELEAKAALHMASKMMRQHNVTRADVFASSETPEERNKHGGHSIVALRRRDGNKEKRVQQAHYLETLDAAMECFFDCKTFTTSWPGSLQVTFYGIAENTVAAAEAYSMAYNLMVEWARPHKGVVGKGSYCLGVCEGLLRAAKDEKVEEEERARRREEATFDGRVRQEGAERQAQLDRLAPDSIQADGLPSLSADDDGVGSGMGVDGDDATKWSDWEGFSDSGDDAAVVRPDFFEEDEDDSETEPNITTDDVDERIDSLAEELRMDCGASNDGRHTKTTPAQAPVATQLSDGNGHADSSLTWQSAGQLIRFREDASNIADEYLKAQNIKLVNARQRKAVQQDKEAYGKGWQDSKKINVRQKTLSEGQVELIGGASGSGS